MMSSKFLQRVKGLAMSSRGTPSTLLHFSEQNSSFWNGLKKGLSTSAQCCKCPLSHAQTKASLENYSKGFHPRCMSSSGRDVVDADLDHNPDVGDIIEDHPVPQNPKKPKQRISVKFNWKNSFVTTDALKLLENLYQSHPQLVEFDESDLVEYLQRMSLYAIDVDKAAKMVIMNPRLLKMSALAIGERVNALRTIELSESQRGHIVRSVPEIFNLPAKMIEKKFTFLKTYLSKDETVDIVCKSVEIFLQSEATLKPKLEYLIKDMSHETKNIASSKAISYPLRHMKTRHEFLIRAGLFKPIPYQKLIKVLERDYKDKSKPRNKYFRPIEVVCYKDEDFLKVCTKGLLSLNEYAAFEELYGAELDVLSEDMEDDEEAEFGEEDEDDPDSFKDAVSLVRASNSIGFFSDVEAKACYF